MTTIRFDIKKDSKNKLLKFLAKKAANLKNMTRLNQQLSLIMLSDVMKHFREEEGPTGKWKESFRAKREGGMTLQDTGRLRNSIVNAFSRKEAKVGTNVKYGIKHQEGEGKLPERKFMWLSKQAERQIENRVFKWVGG